MHLAHVVWPYKQPLISSAAVDSSSHGWHHRAAPRTATCQGAKQSEYVYHQLEHKMQGELLCSKRRQVVAAQQLQQQQHRHHNRSWRQPEQDICRGISLRLKRADSTAATLDVIAAHATHFNEINTALAFAQLARHLRFDTCEGSAAALSSSSYQQLQQLALQQISSFNSRQVNMILTSMAWMHGSSSSSSSDRGDQIADPALDQQQQQWSNPASAAAAVGLAQQQSAQDQITSDQPPAAAAAVVEDLAAELAVRLQQLLDLAEPEDISHCLWSITKLQLLRNPDCSGLVIAATAHGLQHGWIHLLTGKALSSLLWVHAQQRQQQQHQQQQQQQWQQQQWQQLLPALVAAVMQECSQPGFLATWTPQEISMLMWSCAVLKIRIAPPAAAAAAAVAEGQQQQQQQELLDLPHSVLKEVCVLSTQQVVRFSPQGISNTCWALAQLLLPDHQQQQQWQQLLPDEIGQSVQTLLDTFTAAAAAHLQFYKPQEVANILSACAKLQMKPKPLITSVSCYITSNSHHLNPRDVFELLVGFVQLEITPETTVTHALVYRLNQIRGLLQPYELVAAAWALIQLAKPQIHIIAAAARSAAVDVGHECIAAVHQLLDAAAMQVAWEWIADSAEVADSAAAAAAGAVPVGNKWKQLLADPGGRPLVMLLRAAAGSQYFSSNSTSSSSDGSGLDLARQQQQPQHQMPRPRGFSIWLLQQVRQQVSACSVMSLLQLMITLTQIQIQHDQRQQQLLLSICAAADARLLPVLPNLLAEHVIWAAWAIVKLRMAAAAAAAAPAVNDGSSELGTAAAAGKSAAVFDSASVAAEARRFVIACLNSLQQQQQQVVALPDHAVASILHCCAQVQLLPDSKLLLLLLAAAEHRVLQMTGQQQLLLFWSLAEIQHLQQQQQQQQQYQLPQRLVRLVSDQMLIHVQQQLRQPLAPPPPAAAAAAAAVKNMQGTKHRRSSAAAAVAAQALGQQQQQQQPQTWLHGRELQALATACLKLQTQLQDSELLLAAVELWQEQQQQQQLRSTDVPAMQVTAAMHMLCALSTAAAAVPALQLQLPDLIPDTMLLLQQYLQQQQQQQNGSPGMGPLPAVHCGLLITAVNTMAKVRYQPSQQLLLLLSKHLTAAVPYLLCEQLITVLHAFVVLALPVPQQLLAAAAAAAGRALANPGKIQATLATAAAGTGEEGKGSSDHHHHQQQQQQRGQQLPFRSRVKLLWCLLVCQYKHPSSSSSSNRLIVRLARSVLDSRVVKRQHQHQQLLQMLVQCRQLLVTQRYAAVHATLMGSLSDPRSHRPEIIPPDLISSRLQILSKVCLHQDSTAVGAIRQQRLLELLQSTPQTRVLLLQQRLAAEHVSDDSSSSSSVEEGRTLQQQLIAVMPLWIQQQLLQASLKEVAWELLTAGVAAAALKFRHLANGDVALLVSMQHSNPPPRTTTITITSSSSTATSPSSTSSSSSSSGSSGQVAPQVLAIVLESSSNRAVNSGKLLGPSLCRNYLLQDWGCKVVNMPLECWLPDWVAASGNAAAAAMQQQRDGVARQRKLMVQRILSASTLAN